MIGISYSFVYLVSGCSNASEQRWIQWSVVQPTAVELPTRWLDFGLPGM